jgi:hypothetical protein
MRDSGKACDETDILLCRSLSRRFFQPMSRIWAWLSTTTKATSALRDLVSSMRVGLGREFVSARAFIVLHLSWYGRLYSLQRSWLLTSTMYAMRNRENFRNMVLEVRSNKGPGRVFQNQLSQFGDPLAAATLPQQRVKIKGSVISHASLQSSMQTQPSAAQAECLLSVPKRRRKGDANKSLRQTYSEDKTFRNSVKFCFRVL